LIYFKLLSSCNPKQEYYLNPPKTKIAEQNFVGLLSLNSNE
jgi:hypothetical protein